MTQNTPVFQEPDETWEETPSQDVTNPLPTVDERLESLQLSVETLTHKQEETLEYLSNVNQRLTALTDGVNQFGMMLNHIVQTVTQAGQALSEKGVGGLMSLMGANRE